MDKVKKIGVIADDFTGASDAASFYQKVEHWSSCAARFQNTWMNLVMQLLLH